MRVAFCLSLSLSLSPLRREIKFSRAGFPNARAFFLARRGKGLRSQINTHSHVDDDEEEEEEVEEGEHETRIVSPTRARPRARMSARTAGPRVGPRPDHDGCDSTRSAIRAFRTPSPFVEFLAAII